MKKHDTDMFSLAFGAAFLLVAATWGIAKLVKVSWFSVGWVFACGLVLIGVVGVLSAIRLSRGR